MPRLSARLSASGARTREPGLAAIKFRLEQQGRDRRALIGVIGSRTRVHEVLRRDRALSLAMIRRLNKSPNIPAEVLIRPIRRRKRSA